MRIAFGLLGLFAIMAAPVAWGLAGWSVGLTTGFVGIYLTGHALRGAR